MAGVKAAIASIIAPQQAVCPEMGLSREHFSVIIPALFSWEVERTLFYVFHNLKQRYQGSQEAFSPAGIRPSNYGPCGSRRQRLPFLHLQAWAAQWAVGSAGSPRRIGASQISAAPQSRFAALPQGHLPNACPRRGGTLFTHQISKHFMNLPKTPLSFGEAVYPHTHESSFLLNLGGLMNIPIVQKRILRASKTKPAPTHTDSYYSKLHSEESCKKKAVDLPSFEHFLNDTHCPVFSVSGQRAGVRVGQCLPCFPRSLCVCPAPELFASPPRRKVTLTVF